MILALDRAECKRARHDDERMPGIRQPDIRMSERSITE